MSDPIEMVIVRPWGDEFIAHVVHNHANHPPTMLCRPDIAVPNRRRYWTYPPDYTISWTLYRDSPCPTRVAVRWCKLCILRLTPKQAHNAA